MLESRHSPPEAWIPVLGGLAWLWFAGGVGAVGFLFSLVPGCLLLASGVSTLLYPGDVRIPQFTALGGALGVPMALPALIVVGPWTAMALVLASAASFVAAGAISVRTEPHTDGVPAAVLTPRLALQVAIDDAILATMTLRLAPVMAADQERIRREVHAARELFAGRGWLHELASYHRTPPPLALDDPELRAGRARGVDYEHLTFPSGYEPWDEEPGRERWLARVANRTAHAWVLRHRSEPRPWLVCIHGYGMGSPGIDLLAFEAARLHREHGLNFLLPVLPLHGPRRIGRRSGEAFLAGDFLDSVHAEAQAMWDIRRLLSWVRAQGGAPIGVYGLSLGGYNAALLASLEDLAGVIAGIPATDFTRLTWRHGSPLQIRHAERRGLVHDEVAELLRVVSPLALEPRVPHARRYVFAGVADRIVPAEQARDLWRHWERPRMVWYQGGHLTFSRHPDVRRMVMDALRESRLIASRESGEASEPPRAEVTAAGA
jgi:hypothetical protein